MWDLFDPANTWSGFPTLFLWRRTPAKFRYV
jgi:hypothetical protein